MFHQQQAVLHAYTDNKTLWEEARYHDGLIRSFGEAAYHVETVRTVIRQHPRCYRTVKDHLRVLDMFADKDSRGLPTYTHVDKLIGLQSAIRQSLETDSSARDQMYDLLHPPVYPEAGYRSDFGADEYIDSVLNPDFHAPSSRQTAQYIFKRCHYQIAGHHAASQALQDYYDAAYIVRNHFKHGLARPF